VHTVPKTPFEHSSFLSLRNFVLCFVGPLVTFFGRRTLPFVWFLSQRSCFLCTGVSGIQDFPENGSSPHEIVPFLIVSLSWCLAIGGTPSVNSKRSYDVLCDDAILDRSSFASCSRRGKTLSYTSVLSSLPITPRPRISVPPPFRLLTATSTDFPPPRRHHDVFFLPGTPLYVPLPFCIPAGVRVMLRTSATGLVLPFSGTFFDEIFAC